MSSSGGNITQFRRHDGASRSRQLLSSYPHGRLLLSRARRELASLERLADLSVSMPLTNDAWRMLLRILVDTLQGRVVTVHGLAKDLVLSPDIARRYLLALESERLVLVVATKGIGAACGVSDPEPDSIERGVTIGDEGILRVARYFLPEAANE